MPTLTHRRAIALMILVTLLWSMAGVVTRQLEAARSFEVTFWRSLFNAIALMIGLGVLQGARLWRGLRDGGALVWGSGVCWAVMYTAFMVALTLTTVANVLVTMAAAPLLTALLSRIFLHQRLPWRTWAAIFAGGCGIGLIFGEGLGQGVSFVGTLVALGVPLAAACNFTVLQYAASKSAHTMPDMLPAVLIGAVLSALVTLPVAWPLQASAHDLSLLALLGGAQLAVPCLLLVYVSRVLSAAQIALLGLLEVVFGVTWAWLGAGEQPASTTLAGGALVLGALVLNEALGLRASARKG